MSEPKHTPGSWWVDAVKAGGAYGVWSDRPGKNVPVEVCSFGVTSNDPPRVERDANARLIAAAP